MKVVFLGTSSMVPTKDRNHTGILVSYQAENILIDCGEGVQRQLRIANIFPTKVTKVLITHWHGDHVLGLPGFIDTLGKSNYQDTLEVYGPKGTKQYFKNMMDIFVPKRVINIKITEVTKDGIIFENQDFYIESYKVDHSTVCYAYSIIEKPRRKINMDYVKKLGLQEGPILKDLQKGKNIIFKGKKIDVNKATYLIPGKKITIILDTRLCNNCYKIAKDSDLLICESTYASDLQDLAKEYAHMTSKDAALIAKKSKSKRLILTHFSQRYKDISIMEDEARKYFKNSIAARDFYSEEV